MEDLIFVCGRCGHSYKPEDAAEVTETLDTIDGVPYRETRGCCPECGSADYTEYLRCLSCHEHYQPDGLISGMICGNCLSQYLKQPRLLQMYVEDHMEEYADFIADLITGDDDDET